jgi:ribonuclease PH
MASMIRTDGRGASELRPLRLTPDWTPRAEGSCLVEAGGTRVLCTVSVEEGLPRWRSSGTAGWVTAEYAMLPRATHTRTGRERAGARGRTLEIQRLIGRALRSVVDLDRLGPRTLTVDCDVLQADGGTRTAAITGAWVALVAAGCRLVDHGLIAHHPVAGGVSAVSVGVVDGACLLDLNYEEDVRAEVDMNLVVTHNGALVEVQGTAEGPPFPRPTLDALLDLALEGTRELGRLQEEALVAHGYGWAHAGSQ